MFEPLNFILNLRYMGLGMLTIIVVMVILISITGALNKIPSKNEDEENDEQE